MAAHADDDVRELALHGIGPGTVLAERYTAQRRLAQMRGAERWSAQDQTLEREVELLCFPATHEHAEAAVDAARRAAGLDNPRLVRVLDVGVWDGLAFVVEESLHGAHTLTSLLAQGGLPAEEVRRLVGETATALDSASQRGLHHLMLSPRQVLRTHDGSVKVAGLAVAAAIAGSDDVESDEAARIDAVGAVALAYAGLTSRWPLDTDAGGLERAPRVVGGVPAPSEIAAGVPSDLDTLCRLTLNRNQGPVSPGDFAAQIAPWSLTQIGRMVQAPAAPSPAPRFGLPSRLPASAPKPTESPKPAEVQGPAESPAPAEPSSPGGSGSSAAALEQSGATATAVGPATASGPATAPMTLPDAPPTTAPDMAVPTTTPLAEPVAGTAGPAEGASTETGGAYSEEPTVAHHAVRPPVGLSSKTAGPEAAGTTAIPSAQGASASGASTQAASSRAAEAVEAGEYAAEAADSGGAPETAPRAESPKGTEPAESVEAPVRQENETAALAGPAERRGDHLSEQPSEQPGEQPSEQREPATAGSAGVARSTGTGAVKTRPDEGEAALEALTDDPRDVAREEPSVTRSVPTAAGTALEERPGVEPGEKTPEERGQKDTEEADDALPPEPSGEEPEWRSPESGVPTWTRPGSARTEVLSPVPPTSGPTGQDARSAEPVKSGTGPASATTGGKGLETHSDDEETESVAVGARAERSALAVDEPAEEGLAEGQTSEGSSGDREGSSPGAGDVKTEQFRWPTWTDLDVGEGKAGAGEHEGSGAATAAAVAGAVGSALGAAGHAAGAVSERVGIFAKAAAERAAERRAYRQAEEEEAERHRISLDQALLGAHEDLEPPLPMLPAETAAAPTRHQSKLALLIVAGFVVVALLVGLFGASRIGASSEGNVPAVAATTRTVAVTAPPQTVTVSPSTSIATEDSPDRKLAFLSASGFDPQGDGQERNGEAGRVWDGKDSTYWSSEGYQTPDMGGLKDGAGVILDFGQTVKPSEVSLLLPDPATFDLFLAPDRSLDGATKLGSSSDKSGEITIKVTGGASGQYLIVWFTRVSRVSDGAYRATLAEVTATG